MAESNLAPSDSSPGHWHPWRHANLRTGGGRLSLGKHRPIFHQNVEMRSMRVMVDAEIGSTEASSDLERYLVELHADGQSVFRFADEGPPFDVERQCLDDGFCVANGWVEEVAGDWQNLGGAIIGIGEHSIKAHYWRHDPKFEWIERAPVPSAYLDLPTRETECDQISLHSSSQIASRPICMLRAGPFFSKTHSAFRAIAP